MFGNAMPPVIKTLLIVNIGIYLLEHFILNFFTLFGTPFSHIFLYVFALNPIFSDGLNYISSNNFWIWQLITYQFLHGGLWHLFFNMFALWMFGVELEHRWGSARFFLYYLLSGIGAGISQIFIGPLIGQVGPTVGASGAIYGVLLAFGLTFPNRPIFMFPFFIPIPAKLFVIIFAAIELFSGFSSNDGVAHFAHLGGALTGLLLMLFGDKLGIFALFEGWTNKLTRRKSSSVRDFYSQTYERHEQPRNMFEIRWSRPKQEDTFERKLYEVEQERTNPYNPRNTLIIEGEEITQKKIDAILDKISMSGYQSLTEREKKILTELSRKL